MVASAQLHVDDLHHHDGAETGRGRGDVAGARQHEEEGGHGRDRLQSAEEQIRAHQQRGREHALDLAPAEAAP